jgi:putative NIF3 family GTP cyclohydrolase 1 type 2
MSLADFALHVKTSLGAGGVRVADGGKQVSRVAVGGGACGKLMDYAVAKGADTFVIGDCSYDIMMRAHDIGLNLLDAGHFPTENPVAYGFRDCIAEYFPNIRVQVSLVHADCISFY